MAMALAVLAGATASAQVEASGTTVRDHNGRAWKQMDKSMRMGYVIGCLEAHSRLQAAARQNAAYRGEQPVADPLKPLYSFSFGEIQTGLDDFYKEPANAPIPILDALDVLAKKFAGEPSSVVEADTLFLRSLAAKANEK